jgi:ribose 5-phosphate isomerase B
MIGIGADNSGYHLKEHIKKHLAQRKIEHEDIGVFSEDSPKPYWEIAQHMAEKVASGRFERGILICGTGMGMAIVANKKKGIYASCVESIYAARNSRSINNSNILTLWVSSSLLLGWKKRLWMHGLRQSLLPAGQRRKYPGLRIRWIR